MDKAKILIAFLVLTFGMVLTYAGTQALVKQSKSVSNSISTGTLDIKLDKESAGKSSMNYFVDLGKLKPGHSGSEIITVTNKGVLEARVDFSTSFTGLLLNGQDPNGSKGLSLFYKKSVDNGKTWVPFLPGDTNWIMASGENILVKVLYDFAKDFDVHDQSFYQGKEANLNITVNAEQTKNNAKLSDGQPERKVIHALHFDGTNDAVEVQSSALKQYPLTLSAWVKPVLRNDGTSFPTNVISNDDPSKYGNGFGVNVWNGGSELRLEYENGFIPITTFPFKANNWYYIAVVYDVIGTELLIKAYVDGNLIYTSDADDLQVPATMDASNRIVIGKHNDDANYNSARFFKGKIREIRVWHKSQSKEEIIANMSSNSIGNETNLIHYWPLGDAHSRSIKDFTGNGHGSFVADPVWVAE